MSSIQTQNSISDQTAQKSNPSIGRRVLAVGTGVATGYGAGLALSVAFRPCSKSFKKNIDMDSYDKEIFISEAKEFVTKSGIEKKGFKGISIVQLPFLNIFMPDFFNNNLKVGTYVDYLREQKNKMPMRDAFEELENASRTVFKTGTLPNKIIMGVSAALNPFEKLSNILIGRPLMNKSRMEGAISTGLFHFGLNKIYTATPASLLHEVGHAVNKNKSILSSLPFYCRFVATVVLMPAVILNAMLTKKPQKNVEQNIEKKSLVKKLRDFTHNNIGLTLVTLSLPTLAEEALASYRAIKFADASTMLNTRLKSQHKRLLKVAFASYVIDTVILATTAKLAVGVKDKIMNSRSKKHN